MASFWAAVIGAAIGAGLVLDVLTFLLARYGPSGSDDTSWSFRGNGALIIPLGLGPAVLAAGWAAVVRHYRSDSGWLRWAVLAGLLGALLVVASGVSITLPRVAVAASTNLSLLVLAWMVLAPLLAGVLPVGTPRSGRTSLPVHVAAAVVFGVALFASFTLASMLLPPGS